MKTKPLMTASDWILAFIIGVWLVALSATYIVPYAIELDHRAKCEVRGMLVSDGKCVSVEEFVKKTNK